MYEWEMSEYEKIEQCRNNYRQFGLAIFESFEEYCKSCLDEDSDEH